MSHTEQMREALEELLTDVVIAQGNMRNAAKYDHRWEGCAEAIQPRVDAARAALTAPAAKCATCNGHGLVGGFMQDGSGYGEGCPDCNPDPAPAAEVPWSVHDGGAYLQHDDVRFDAVLRLDGDFETQDQRLEFAESVRDALNGAKAAATAAEVPEAMGDEPALPVAAHRGPDGTGSYFDSFTADQLRTYAKQYAQWQSTRLRGGVTEGAVDAVEKALRRAWQLGKTYWQQADSDSFKQHRKAEETRAKFSALLDEVQTMLTAAPQAPADALDEGVVRAAQAERERGE